MRLEDYDWLDLEDQFAKRMEAFRAVEEGIWEEWRGWGEVFGAWASTISVYDEERAAKRYVVLSLPDYDNVGEIGGISDQVRVYVGCEQGLRSHKAARRVWRRRGCIVCSFSLPPNSSAHTIHFDSCLARADIKVVQAFESALALLSDG